MTHTWMIIVGAAGLAWFIPEFIAALAKVKTSVLMNLMASASASLFVAGLVL